MTDRGRVVALMCFATWSGMALDAHAETTAFYYGPSIPRELSTAYDQIVVEPGHVPDVQALAKAGAVPVAYFSIGEVAKDQMATVDRSWLVGHNEAWASAVMDVENAGYRAYVLDHLEQLWRAGYRRFFLDTLDSYQLGTQDPTARERARRALCTLIRSMAARHPDARWWLNRGFELLPEISDVVHGVVAESLFDRWDASKKSYVRVPDGDRDWLLARLREVRSRYKLPVVVIDYRPPAEREAARATARKIVALGFQPWVCGAALDDIGVGSIEIMPRRVLLLTDRPDAGAQVGPARWLAPVIEYLGYVPDYRRIADGLPRYELRGRYAGIITLFQSGSVGSGYEVWLRRQIEAGMRVVIFGALGFNADSTTARALGIEPLPPPTPGAKRAYSTVAIASRDALIGFEAEPPLRELEGVPIRAVGEGLALHLEIRTRDGPRATAIASTRFGGLALSHVFALRGFGGERAWVLDPFAFLEQALALPGMPVPDVTTESGRRVALFAIDAQGLSDRARMRGRPSVASVLRREILDRRAWPHAIGAFDPHQGVSECDLAEARALLQAGAAYDDAIAAGSTAVRGDQRSLTGIEPLWRADDPEQIPAPMAADTSFLAGADEAYALRRVVETFELTDAPRRLRPLSLQYHAYAVSSPGGVDALGAVYAWLERQALFAVRASDYRARVRAFREQVIGRQPDGSFEVFGGEALRTLRLPAALGRLDLQHSLGVGAVAALPQGRYVTFVTHGPRRIGFVSGAVASVPILTDTNGRIEEFMVESVKPPRLRLRVVADGALTLRIAELPAGATCSMAIGRRVITAVVGTGGVASFATTVHDSGEALVTCTGASGA